MLLGILLSNCISSEIYNSLLNSIESDSIIIDKMTLDDKLKLLHGVPGTYVGNIPGIQRLGIPSIRMQDGPQGFRVTALTGPVGTTTAWPSALTVSSSWDIKLIHQWFIAMAKEFRGQFINSYTNILYENFLKLKYE